VPRGARARRGRHPQPPLPRRPLPHVPQAGAGGAGGAPGDSSHSVSVGAVTVVGVDGALGPEARAALAEAEVVLGAARLLDLVEDDVERVVLGAVAPALERIRGRRAVVLAGGDPGFFGIVRLLRERGH